MNGSVGCRLCLASDEEQRATRFGVAIEPMVRRAVGQRAFAGVDPGARRPEHCDSNAHLALGRCSFPIKNSGAALHPIRLPRTVEGAAAFAVNPPVIRNEIQARAVGGRIPGIEPPQAVQHPIECPLPSRRVCNPENVGQVIVGHEQRPLLDGPLEGGAFEGEELDLRREVVSRGLLSR